MYPLRWWSAFVSIVLSSFTSCEKTEVMRTTPSSRQRTVTVTIRNVLMAKRMSATSQSSILPVSFSLYGLQVEEKTRMALH